MIEKVYRLQNKIDGLATRERALILAVVLLAVFTIFDLVLFSQVRSQYLALQGEIDNMALQNQSKLSEIELIKLAISDGSGETRLQQIESLQSAIEENENILLTYINAVTPPEQLIPMLYGILHPASDFQLIEVMADKPHKIADISHGEETIGAYKQDIHLHVRGTFFSIVDYLKLLERSDWVLFWNGLEYAVDSYPVADVKLHFYTMTTGAGVYGE